PPPSSVVSISTAEKSCSWASATAAQHAPTMPRLVRLLPLMIPPTATVSSIGRDRFSATAPYLVNALSRSPTASAGPPGTIATGRFRSVHRPRGDSANLRTRIAPGRLRGGLRNSRFGGHHGRDETSVGGDRTR